MAAYSNVSKLIVVHLDGCDMLYILDGTGWIMDEIALEPCANRIPILVSNPYNIEEL